MNKVVIIGGIGYLGINLSYYHWMLGDDVNIITRYRSLEKRRFYTSLLKRLSVNIHSYKELSLKKALKKLDEIRPEIAYIVVGKLSGSLREMIESNFILPTFYLKYLEKHHKDCLNIYISHAFNFKSLSKFSRKIDGKRIFIYTDYKSYPKYYTALINKNYLYSKYLAEDYIFNRLTNSYIFKPGLLMGFYPTHPEWKILGLLGRAKISVPLLNKIPITIAIDIAKITKHIYYTNVDGPRYLLTCKLSPTIIELTKSLASESILDYALNVKQQSFKYLGLELPIPLLMKGNEYLYPYNLEVLYGFNKWTKLVDGIRIIKSSKIIQ